MIGGGPAGSTAAALMAQAGATVLLLEQERFPRYVVGESMLPYCYFPLERLGLLDTMQQLAFVSKQSVQFVSSTGKRSKPFYFQQHMNHPAAKTWQVERIDFDMMLLDNARAKGVEVVEETKVLEFLHNSDGAVVGVRARDKQGTNQEYTAPMTVDASGRKGLAVARKGWRVMDPNLKKVAVWTYFEGALRDEGIDEGATTIANTGNKTWFWYIPLRNNKVSVGIVADKQDIQESKQLAKFFDRQVEKNDWIKRHLATGKPVSDYRVTSDFSYRSKHCAADGLILAGDAFSFLDPVFSSGLFLALHSGVLAADAVLAARAQNDFSAKRFEQYGNLLTEALNNMRQLVYAFYNPNFNFSKLFKKYPHLRTDVTDALIGNLHRDYTELFAAMYEFSGDSDKKCN